MIDPLSIVALTVVLTGVLNGATEEAGASAYTSLVRLIRGAFGKDHSATKSLEAGPGVAEPEVLAQLLSGAAASDPVVRAEVVAWLEQFGGGSVDGATINSVSGDVHGSVVQGRDFHGPVHLD